jgi:hypothetical protein
LPSAIEITPTEYRNPPAAVEIEPSVAGFSKINNNLAFVFQSETALRFGGGEKAEFFVFST